MNDADCYIVLGTGEKYSILPTDISDGYHTFDELYEHRVILFIALMQCHKDKSWKSKLHSDGSKFEGWFIGGINKQEGSQITYHLPESYWSEVDVETLERAPNFDGHTSQNVLTRISNLKPLDIKGKLSSPY